MTILRAQELSVSFSGPALLDDVSLHVESGERIALVGRNGAGKTTLLRVLSGQVRPDGGRVDIASGVSVAKLDQEISTTSTGPVSRIVLEGHALGSSVVEHAEISALGDPTPAQLERLEGLASKIEQGGAWDLQHLMERVLTRLGLEPAAKFETLSGGFKRRALLARALLGQPDLLLLDEPTNHLEVEAIEWLEERLVKLSCALVFVTHDRSFLRRVATRIIELDRGDLTSFPGDYDTFLRRQAELAGTEERHRALRAKKLAAEEVWVRQGIKARRTRNEGRVRALERLREKVRDQRARTGTARLQFDVADSSGKMVFETKALRFAYEDKPIVEGLDLRVLRGDKIGILGPNGSGKTTLLSLLQQTLEPTGGSVRHGARLEIATFDQHREQLDPSRTVGDNVSGGAEHLDIAGSRRHIIGYLQDFLFAPEQIRGPIDALSGGERNRLLLARLFARPFNVLVMDEPTNDLDIETLEILEERLVSFEGTLLLVSHDRTFIDNVVTSTLVMEGGGRVGMYAGGYSDWLRQRPKPVADVTEKAAAEKREAAKPSQRAPSPKKLSYREKQELAELPGRIEALETEQAELNERAADPATYQADDGDIVRALGDRMASVEAELEVAYERWEALEGRDER